MLAAQQGRDLGGQAAQNDIGRVDDVPGPLDVAGLRGVRAHGRTFVSLGEVSAPAWDRGNRVGVKAHQGATRTHNDPQEYLRHPRRAKPASETPAP